jgi:hypothetical protein
VIGKDGQGVWTPEADAVTFSWQIDISWPTVSISNVRNNGVIASGFIIGTASDDLGVSLVDVQLDGGSYQAATGTTAWRFPLPTGSSTWQANSLHSVTVRAIDALGHDSSTTISVRKGPNKDVNGDGYSDIIVGADGWNSGQGRAYVFHSSGLTGITITSAASASSIITGEEGGFGGSVALGDVNGDGYADAVVGADGWNGGQGRAYVLHSSGASGITTASAASASGIITGEEGGFGGSIAVGDVNGDGYADVVVGAEGYDSGQGRAYVFHSGGSSGIGIASAASADGILTGEASSRFGGSIALGDVNGDSYADAVVGADGYNGDQGRAYVFHSSGSGISSTSADLASRIITGEEGRFGGSIALGDVNRDGYADAVVGADGYNGDQGRAYVFHSSSSGISIEDAALASRIITGEEGGFGGSVATGDVNGDGYADALVGAAAYGGNQGRAYVFHSSGTSSGITISTAGSASRRITGESGSSRFGSSVALADVNGNGYADAIVGANAYSTDQGRSYVFHSNGSGGISIGSAGSASRTITGETGSGFGVSVALGRGKDWLSGIRIAIVFTGIPFILKG